MNLSRAACLSLPFLAVAMLGACQGDSPEASIAAARAHLAKQDDRAALIELKNALQKNPDAAEARFLMGKTLLDMGDAKLAEVELGKALKLGHPASAVVPLQAEALNLIGRPQDIVGRFASTTLDQATANADLRSTVASAYLQLGDSRKADAQLADALKSVPGYAPALLMQARGMAAALDFDGALRRVEQVLAADPSLADAWRFKGDLLYFAKQDSPGALVAYAEALKRKPTLVAAHSGSLSVLIAQKNWKAATAQLANFQAALPGSPEAKYFQALLAFHRQDFKAAKQLAQQLLNLAPDNPRVLHLAGAVELHDGAYLQAEAYIGKALQNAPGNTSALRLMGQTYLQSGRPAKTLALLLPYVQSDAAADPEMVALVANAYLADGDINEAEGYFARAARMNPNDVGSRTALALTRLAAGNVEAGFDELHSISSTDSGTTADLALISALAQRKDYDGAVKAIAKLELKDPKNALAPTLRGRVDIARGAYASARESFERALAVSPMYFPAAAALASLDLADKKPELAQQRFEKLLAVDPKNLQALLAIAQLRYRLGDGEAEVNARVAKAIQLNPMEAAPRLLLFERYMKAKAYKLALATAQEAVAALPDNAAVRDALGRAQVATGDVNQAIASYSKLVELQPQSPEPHLRLAEIYASLKQTDSAVQSLKRALIVAPDSVVAQRGLFSILVANKRIDEARTYARSLQKGQPDGAQGYLFEGELDASARDWDAAAKVLRAGLEKKKTTGVAVKLHTALLSGGRRAEADRLAATWLREFPKDDVFLYYLADGSLNRKEYAAAEGYYKSFIELRPDSPIALNNLAWLSWKLHKPGGIEYAERANRLSPNEPPLMDTLAMLLAEDNQTARALEIQQRAIALRPDVPALRLTLAKILIKSGDKARAKSELETLARLGGSFGDQPEVSSLLKLL